MALVPSSLYEIKGLGEQGVFDDKAQVLLSAPVFGPVIRNLLDSIRKHNPGDHQGQGTSGAFDFCSENEL